MVRESHATSSNQGGTPARGCRRRVSRPRTSLNGSLQRDGGSCLGAKTSSGRQPLRARGREAWRSARWGSDADSVRSICFPRQSSLPAFARCTSGVMTAETTESW